MNRGLFIEPLMPGEQSAPWVTDAERKVAAAFAPERRKEFFTWRAVVRRELGPVGIGYNAVGAPIIADRPGVHIGVSHGAGRVAVCISDRPCAVDIECTGRDFHRIVSRYLTLEEQSLGSGNRFEAAAWCIKECLYKLSGMRDLNLLTDLRFTAIGADWIEGAIKKEKPVRFSLRYFDEAIVVWKL